MNADALEREAVTARRVADVAKHIPMTEDDYARIEATQLAACEAAAPLCRRAIDLSNDYANALVPMGNTIKRLRAEALYWKQKYELTQSKNTPTAKGGGNG